MKPKNFHKKLVLNKETITNLTPQQMRKNRAGGGPTEPPLASCNDIDKTECAVCTDPIDSVLTLDCKTNEC